MKPALPYNKDNNSSSIIGVLIKKVRNINGTRPLPCSCGSWLEHWRRFSSRELPAYCAEIGCLSKPEYGALVQHYSFTDLGWYVIPVCGKHSLTAVELDVSGWTILVPAEAKLTCGK